MDNIFDDYDYEKEYDYDYEKKHDYDSEQYLKCNHFSKLMFLIINANSIPNGHTLLKNYILTNQYEINNKNAKGWTALHIAARNSNIYSSGTVQLLLENNTNVNTWKQVGLETVKLLLENGADVNLATYDDDSTALMVAAQYSNTYSSLEIVELLLEKGANINLINRYGWTALMMAAHKSNKDSSIETVILLLEKGANVNLTSKNGWTALTLAAQYSSKCNLKTIKLLLEKGANIYIINKYNKTFFNYVPFEYLKECLDIVHQINNHKLCMKILLKQINKRFIKLLLHPDSLRIKLMGIKWSHNNNLFKELLINDPNLLSYFGITDEESLKWKIIDNLKYSD